MSKIKSFTLILGVLLITFLAGRLVFAWVEPSQAPPGGNVDAPINVGSTAQTKTANITVFPGFLTAQTFYDADAGGWFINPSGSSAFSGNLGLGINPAVYKLDVAGTVNMTGFRMTTGAGLGRVLASDASGVGTWALVIAGAPTDATYITQTANGTLSNEQSLSGLLSGYMKVTTVTGVVTSIATIPATEGGTAQTTYTAGDILYASAANTLAKRAIGSAGQVLTVSGGLPVWANVPSGFADPMTTAGDIIIRNTVNTTARLGIGSAGQVLTVSGGVPVWAAAAGGGVGGSGTLNYVAKFTAGTTIGNSLIFDNGTSVGIGTTTPGARLHATGGTVGVQGEGTTMGGYFKDSDNSGYAYVGRGDYGVYSVGNTAGGYFQDSNDLTDTYIAYGSWGIYTGQNAYFGGNVGIGTTSISQKLEVSGNIKMTGADFMIDNTSRRGGAAGDYRRALVHDNLDVLTINYGGDYTGGTNIVGNLTVGGKSNLVNPLTTWETWNFSFWGDAANLCVDFTPAQASSYTAMALMIAPDFTCGIETVALWTGPGCTGNQVGSNIQIFKSEVVDACKIMAHQTVIVPTTVRSAKVVSCYQSICNIDWNNNNIMITTYFK
jgi:hypothetical protein